MRYGNVSEMCVIEARYRTYDVKAKVNLVSFRELEKARTYHVTEKLNKFLFFVNLF